MISLREQQLLLQHLLGISREDLIASPSPSLSPTQQAEFDALCARREAGEPIAKIIGKKAFWKDEFFTSRDTLDPRPESEHIIEAVLKYRPDVTHPWRVLDMGTGTGCLLLSVLGEYPHATGVGMDVSEAALTVAKRNALALSLQKRADFMRLSWTEPHDLLYDIIITNPPYIPSVDIEHLEVDVARYDPLLALDGGADGLTAYRDIFQKVRGLLHQHGLFICEIGIDQQQEVKKLGESSGLQCIEMVRDFADIVRVLVFVS